MTDQKKENKNIIDLGAIAKILWAKKKVFFIMWPIVFAISCLWILPQPRYYSCNVALAPEEGGEEVAGGLAGLASNFGINFGGASSDAIYPLLYPELFESNAFIVSLFNINVKTEDGLVDTDYYTYMAKHQKQNILTQPFITLKIYLSQVFSSKSPSKPSAVKEINDFRLSEFDYNLTQQIKDNITCSVDKKTNVISITVQDQDPVICASLADSIRERLQNFIIEYRTKKTRIDVEHYQHLADSANLEYRSAVNEYAVFCDANQDVVLQSQQSKRDELENEMQMKYNTYQVVVTQLEAMKAKLQERTPAFTTLKSATVPIKPVGPKRVRFVFFMLILSSLIASGWLIYDNGRKNGFLQV